MWAHEHILGPEAELVVLPVFAREGVHVKVAHLTQSWVTKK